MGARKVLHELNESVENVEYVGTMCTLSVVMGDNDLRYEDIQNMMLNDPDIPNDWVPEQRNMLRMYLDCMNALKNTQSLKHFEPWDDEFGFDPYKEHAAYMGMRTHYSRDSRFPTSHNILHVKKSEELDEFNNHRLETDEAVTIQLERTEGTSETDNSTSKFRINFPSDMPQEYYPLVFALHNMFKDRVNRIYDSAAIRELVLDIIRHKLGGQNVNTSLYFVDSKDADSLTALKNGLARLDTGIDLFLFHVHHHRDKPSDHPVNETFKSVSRGVTRSLVDELKEFFDEVKSRKEDEENVTRADTWDRRAGELRDLKKRITSFKNKQMLEADMVDHFLEGATEIIKSELL